MSEMTPNLDGNDTKEETLSTAANNHDQFSYVHSFVRTPPPGFTMDSAGTSGLTFGNPSRAGAGSAPPQSLISEEFKTIRSLPSLSNDVNGHDPLRMMLRPNDENGRSTSFVNLAAALGEGLAESIGDSLKESKDENDNSRFKEPDHQSRTNRDNPHQGVDNSIQMGVDNFARQSRHALTHLVGSTRSLSIDPRNMMNGSKQSLSSLYEESPLQNESRVGNSNNRDIVTIVEPGNTPTPTNSHFHMDDSQNKFSPNRLQHGLKPPLLGRASAPPQVFTNNNFSHHIGSQLRDLQYQTADSLRKRASDLKGTNDNQIESSSDYISTSSLNNGHNGARTSNHLKNGNETKTQLELRPFIWNPTSGPSGNGTASIPSSASRGIAVFGVSQLPLSEIRSTCEAFGSLLYFRSEFCAMKDVIFIAYHDLRSACHASNELKSYLQRISSSHLNEIDSIHCQDGLKVMYSVSLAVSSEYDDSALIFSNLPFGVNKEAVINLMASFGAVQSVDQIQGENEVVSYLVRFFDVQDANHCMLEIQSTMPWGSSVIIRLQNRLESERKKGQELLALISKWRMKSSTVTPQYSAGVSHNTQRDSLSLSPSLSDGNKSCQNITTPTTLAESPSPPLPVLVPQAPQLVVGPDGQYSYVIVQPSAYHTSGPQFLQSGTVVPPHLSYTHQQPSVPSQQYVLDGHGQHYWIQNQVVRDQVMSNPHAPNYHQMQGSQIAYQVMPIYPVANPTTQTDPNLRAGANHYAHNNNSVRLPESRKDNISNADSGNQRNNLDIESVKQGWDIRTSLMIRNIPNKYTRSMLLSEFKEIDHGPGKIDFFYLPIDFRNKCNRGYAFVNFVNYRDIITFYQAYNGKGWKTFKSDKICDITYARIQGKSSMLKRFQNSALMEKDPEYRPVVFNEKGEVCSPTAEDYDD